MANFDLITLNSGNGLPVRQASSNITIDFSQINLANAPTSPGNAATKAYVDAAIAAAITNLINAGTGTGLVFDNIVSGVARIRNLKQGAGITITTVGDDIIISGTGFSATYFVDYVTGQTTMTIPVGNTYGIGSNQLAVYRNGLRMFNSNSVGSTYDQYQEASSNTVSLSASASSAEVFEFVNQDQAVGYSNLITGITGTVLTVPTYTQGNDSFRIFRNGLLMNHDALGNLVDQYTEATTTTINLAQAALSSDVFVVESYPAPTFREDHTGITGTTVNLTDVYTLGNQKLLVYRNGVFMVNSLTVGSAIDQYQETSTTSITLQVAAVSTDVFSFIYK